MLSTTRANQVAGIVARGWVPLSREEWEGSLLASCARATRTLGRCSLDTRSGRPNRPPSCERRCECGRSVRGGQTRWSPVLAQRAVLEDPRWTRAVGAHLARLQGRRLDTLTMKQWSLDARSDGQPWPLPEESHRGGSPWLHSDVKTTIMYIHALNRGPGGVRSPLDGL
jgi:hypothetical protein